MSEVPLKTSPIQGRAQAHGARVSEAAGWRVVDGYHAVEAEVAAAREGVALADVSAMGKVQVEGDAAVYVIQAVFAGAFAAGGEVELGAGLADSSRHPSRLAQGAAGQALGMTEAGGRGGLPGVGAGWRGAGVEVYCLRPDLYLVLTPPGGEAAVAQLAEAQAGQVGLVTVTDLTHGLAALAVIGPHGRGLLRRVCALDVGEEAFPNETARATSVAKTRQLIVRRDEGEVLGFTLVGARSLAGYVWEALIDAGKDFGIVPVGVDAMEKLRRL